MDIKVLKERARGCLVGLAIGDALGAPVEGWTPQKIKDEYGLITDFLNDEPAGTDDTEYAMLTALNFIKYGRNITSESVAQAWLDLINSGDMRGGGFSEAAAIDNLRKGLKPPASGNDNPEMWSDGAAMRIAPAGIIAAGKPAAAARLAAIDGQVSHAADGIYTAQAVAAGVAVAMTGANYQEVISAALANIPEDSWSYRQIERAVQIGLKYDKAVEAIPDLYENVSILHYYWADVAPEAVALAFGAFAAARGDYKDAIFTGVNVGRDADTIAAIAGALAGTVAGINQIPEAWRRRITTAKGVCIRTVAGIDLNDLAEDLVNQFCHEEGLLNE